MKYPRPAAARRAIKKIKDFRNREAGVNPKMAEKIRLEDEDAASASALGIGGSMKVKNAQGQTVLSIPKPDVKEYRRVMGGGVSPAEKKASENKGYMKTTKKYADGGIGPRGRRKVNTDKRVSTERTGSMPARAEAAEYYRRDMDQAKKNVVSLAGVNVRTAPSGRKTIDKQTIGDAKTAKSMGTKTQRWQQGWNPGIKYSHDDVMRINKANASAAASGRRSNTPIILKDQVPADSGYKNVVDKKSMTRMYDPSSEGRVRSQAAPTAKKKPYKIEAPATTGTRLYYDKQGKRITPIAPYKKGGKTRKGY